MKAFALVIEKVAEDTVCGGLKIEANPGYQKRNLGVVASEVLDF